MNDISGVGGLVRPGNFVDVMGTFEFGKPLGMTNGRMQCRTSAETRVLMQNMQVVAVEGTSGRADGTPARRDAGAGGG